MARSDWTKTYPGDVTTESSSTPVGKWLALAVLVVCAGLLVLLGRSLVDFRTGDGLSLDGWTEDVLPQEDGRCWWVGTGELRNGGEQELDLRLAFMKPGGSGLRQEFSEPLPPGDTAQILLRRPMVDCDQPVDDFKHGKLEITYLSDAEPDEQVRRFNVQS